MFCKRNVLMVASFLVGWHLRGVANQQIGGNSIDDDKYLSYAAILKIDSSSFHCGGVVVGARFVLTAQHCFDDDDNFFPLFQVQAGYRCNSATNCGRPSELIPIKFAFNHPEGGDMTLLELHEPISLRDIKPAIPHLGEETQPDQATLRRGRKLSLITAGREGGVGRDTSRVQKLKVKYIGTKRCRKEITDKALLQTTTVCTKSKVGNPCLGDSGSPLFVKGKEMWKGRDVVMAVQNWHPRSCDDPTSNATNTSGHFRVADAAKMLTDVICDGPYAEDWCPLSLEEKCIVETLAAQNFTTDAMVTRMRDPSTPQHRAIQWLANEDTAGLDCTDENRLRYRYLFSLLYFATGGSYWTHKANFLSEKFVCNWWDYRDKEEAKDPLGLWCLLNSTGGVDAYLNLMDNNLTGTIPEELILLDEAHTLYLGKNKLTGTLPRVFGDFPAIVDINVEENDLTGPIPEKWGKLATLKVLNVTDNRLTGAISSSLADIPTLGWFYAANNKFVGRVPVSFRGHPVLERLVLSNNALTGNLAEIIESLPRQLEYLWLGANLVTGTIPSLLGDEFPNMTSLDLRTNPGILGTIPASFNKWSKLWQLTLNECNLSGEIPFKPDVFPGVNLIQLFNNQLSGAIPEAFFTYTDLAILHLSKNNLVGTIPSVVGTLRNLRQLGLGWNDLEGPIPSELGNLLRLEHFGCSHNGMTGTLPTELGLLFNLEILAVRNNTLTGTIPSELGNLISLTEFMADHNEMVGTLPQSFVNLGKLRYLDLSNTELIGSISFLCANMIDILAADCHPDGEEGSLEVVCDCCSICCDSKGDCFGPPE